MNKNKQLILIRHGLTDWNISGRRNSFTDIPINSQGVSEITKLAGYLRLIYPHAKIWSSPAKRAQESAAIISKLLNSNYQTLAEAGEVYYGRFEGMTPKELDIDHSATGYAAWEDGAKIEGVESLEDVAARAKRVFNEINSSNSDQCILVSHGTFIRILICVIAFLAPPTSFSTLKIDNASISELLITDKRVRLSQFNNKCYLTPPLM